MYMIFLCFAGTKIGKGCFLHATCVCVYVSVYSCKQEYLKNLSYMNCVFCVRLSVYDVVSIIFTARMCSDTSAK